MMMMMMMISQNPLGKKSWFYSLGMHCLTNALCESIRYQAKSEQKCPTSHGEAALCTPHARSIYLTWLVTESYTLQTTEGRAKVYVSSSVSQVWKVFWVAPAPHPHPHPQDGRTCFTPSRSRDWRHKSYSERAKKCAEAKTLTEHWLQLLLSISKLWIGRQEARQVEA